MREIKFRAWREVPNMVMRQLKFRAWSPLKNQYIYANVIHGFDGGKHLIIDLSTISQFTGLLDKQGVEIYEGDIDERGLIDFRNGSFVLVHNPTCRAEAEGECHFDYLTKELIEFLNIEIIGNIYENPELLGD